MNRRLVSASATLSRGLLPRRGPLPRPTPAHTRFWSSHSARPTVSARVGPLHSDLFRRHHSVSAADLQFGQPLHETHPHLLGPGELTPGITALEYASRRANLASRLPVGSVAVVAAAETKYRSGAVFYDFCQDADFFYLTGFLEPEALAVIECTGPGGEHVFHLFVRPKDARAEQWDGARSGVQAAIDVFNADKSGDIAEIDKLLPPILSRASDVYSDIPANLAPRSGLTRSLLGQQSLSHSSTPLSHAISSPKPLRPTMNALRVVKSDAEIGLMRKAGQLSGRAITSAMSRTFAGERDLMIDIETGFLRNGLDRSAYVPVVAGGKNGLSIHYVSNDCLFRNDDEMVLIDAGGEASGYATDISRTWPVRGRFSDAQRDLYSVVLDVQRKCIKMASASAKISLDQLHREAERGLRDGLVRLGFDITGDGMRVLFPHHLGHYLGIEVHDCSGYPRHDALKVNQVITVEPGVYVPDDDRWPRAFRGMGIRIEDSVCVKEEGPYVLTTEAVKEIVDIEALRS